MLINSSVVKGKCPICGAANCACGGPSNVMPVDATARTLSGKLVKVPLPGRPGASVQIDEQEAIRLGLLPKKREPVRNKKRATAPNKGRG